MKVIKEGNTKKQCTCEYCGTVIEYDVKEDIPVSGIQWLKFVCPTCENTIIPNVKTDVQNTIHSLAHKETIKKLKTIYEKMKKLFDDKYFSYEESIVLNILLSIISKEIND